MHYNVHENGLLFFRNTCLLNSHVGSLPGTSITNLSVSNIGCFLVEILLADEIYANRIKLTNFALATKRSC